MHNLNVFSHGPQNGLWTVTGSKVKRGIEVIGVKRGQQPQERQTEVDQNLLKKPEHKREGCEGLGTDVLNDFPFLHIPALRTEREQEK